MLTCLRFVVWTGGERLGISRPILLPRQQSVRMQLVDDIADYEATQRDLLLLFARYLVTLSKEESILKQIAMRRQSDGDVQQARGPSGNRTPPLQSSGYSSSRCHPGSIAFQGGNMTGYWRPVGHPGFLFFSGVGLPRCHGQNACRPKDKLKASLTWSWLLTLLLLRSWCPRQGWTTSCLVRAKAWRIDHGVPGMLLSASWTLSDNSKGSAVLDCCLRAVERCMDYAFSARRSLE